MIPFRDFGSLTAERDDAANKWRIVLEESETIADVRSGVGMSRKAVEGYARLFAASPRLFQKALRLLNLMAGEDAILDAIAEGSPLHQAWSELDDLIMEFYEVTEAG